jgi:hypothetical protein
VILVIAATVASLVWFLWVGWGAAAWPSGSSLPGFTFGVVGGLIIIFELLLWWKKKVRVWRIGRAQAWLRAHIWLGLFTGPVLVLHSGLRFGGVLSTVLLILLFVVIASGIYGLILQQYLPRLLLDQVPAETIYSQIDYLVDQLIREGNVLVRTTCGAAPGEVEQPLTVADPTGGYTDDAFVIVGSVRTVGRVHGKVLETRTTSQPVPDSEPLREFYNSQVEPFLRHGRAARSLLEVPTRAEVAFRDLKTKVPPAAHAAIDTLEGFCNQRRQWERQSRIHFWLHSWLWLHLPLSIALVVLMIVHIFVALKYW